MRAGRTEAGEVERLAARELFARQRQALLRERRVDLVEAGACKDLCGEPFSKAESGCA